jgi:hypothetical protein
MQLRGPDIVVDKVRAKKNIISGSGATASLSEFDSGSQVLLDRAAGIVFTLPAACAIGTNYTFVATVSVTTNAYKIITGAGTELLIGGYVSIDTDSSNATAVFTGNGTNHIALNMTAASSNALGGIQGTTVTFTKLTATLWQVTGFVECGGTPATAFATS